MQDRITDDLTYVRPSNGASTQLREKSIVRYVASVLLAAVFGLVTACAATVPSREIDTEAWGANYTEDYIYDFMIQTAVGKNTGVGGAHVAEFSRGGTGGIECCAPMPGVGQTVKVVWRVGGRRDDESKWKIYSRTAVVTGATSTDRDAVNFVIVRFFPGHNVEAEFVSESSKPDGKPSPRVDKLFYGQRVMRHLGE